MKIKNPLILAISLLLILYVLFSKQISYHLIRHETKEYSIEKVTREEVVKNQEEEAGDFNFDNVSSISAEQVLFSQRDKAKLPVIGYISIPDIDMKLPLFKGVGGDNMVYGAGTLSPDQKMGEGNYSLASHHVFGIEESEKMLFSPLDKAKAGQSIFLTDKKSVFVYKITEVFVVEPEQVEVLDEVPGKKVVTLVTCTDPEASQRLIVRGELESVRDWKKTDSQIFNN